MALRLWYLTEKSQHQDWLPDWSELDSIELGFSLSAASVSWVWGPDWGSWVSELGSVAWSFCKRATRVGWFLSGTVFCFFLGGIAEKPETAMATICKEFRFSSTFVLAHVQRSVHKAISDWLKIPLASNQNRFDSLATWHPVTNFLGPYLAAKAGYQTAGVIVNNCLVLV